MAMHGDVEVVVLTALPIEYAEFRAHLHDVERASDDAGTQYELGLIKGGTCRVALAEIGEGNDGAAVLAGHAIIRFHPRAMFFVGVAGALRDDVDLGDVVVATRVYGYHSGKVADDGFLSRPRVFEADNELLQRARFVARPMTEFRVHLGPVAAGEVVLNSRRTGLLQQLEHSYNDAVAIEMESAGMARAGHVGRVPVLTIRGISDHADGAKAAAEVGGSQRRAARHAAKVCAALVADLPFAPMKPVAPVLPRATYYLALIAATGLRLPVGNAVVVPLLHFPDVATIEHVTRGLLIYGGNTPGRSEGSCVSWCGPGMCVAQELAGVPSTLQIEAWRQLWEDLGDLARTLSRPERAGS